MNVSLEHSSWFESMPDGCPPSDAVEANGTFYRLVTSLPAQENDFLSHFTLYPQRNYTGRECKAKAVSLYLTPEDCERIKALSAALRDKRVGKLTLTPRCGQIRDDQDGENHFSWWRYSGFDPIEICEAP